MPIRTVSEAINEATRQLLESSPDYFLIGEGITDHKRAFGTTNGLKDEFPSRVFDMPVSENAVTGICVGAAISGKRPIMVHMRADFMLYSMDQIVNSAAKMHAMYGGQLKCPMVIKAVMGRGFGQGYQHAQRFESLFAAIPGLRVVCPSNAYDAKGLLIWAARNNNPVLYFEHRWIHDLKCEVPSQMYEVPPFPKVMHHSRNLNHPACKKINTYGYLVHEAMAAVEHNPYLNVIDTRSPYEANWIEESCCPPAPSLSKGFYPCAEDLGAPPSTEPHDIPNKLFTGPF